MDEWTEDDQYETQPEDRCIGCGGTYVCYCEPDGNAGIGDEG